MITISLLRNLLMRLKEAPHNTQTSACYALRGFYSKDHAYSEAIDRITYSVFADDLSVQTGAEMLAIFCREIDVMAAERLIEQEPLPLPSQESSQAPDESTTIRLKVKIDPENRWKFVIEEDLRRIFRLWHEDRQRIMSLERKVAEALDTRLGAEGGNSK